MPRTLLLVLLPLLLMLSACAQPLPPERAAYVGTWRNGDTSLTITAGGRVAYFVSRDNGFHKKIQAPLQRFEGNDFVVGVGPFATTFVVSAPPQARPRGWTMTVDGVELHRVD